jgi:hypothetical protein
MTIWLPRATYWRPDGNRGAGRSGGAGRYARGPEHQVRSAELGAASTVVSFFRTLGGTIGVSVLGAVLASHVSRYTTAGLARLGTRAPAGRSIPALPSLPAPVRSIVEDAFGHGTGDLFLYVTPFALVSLISILWIKEVPLRTSSALQAHRDD